MKTRYATCAAASLAFLSIHASAATLYVDLNSTNPVPPYATWSTAATNIQDAVDAATNGDLILVTNGVYATGGRIVHGTLTNRVIIDKDVTLQSVSGPAVTTIEGYRDPQATQGNTNSVRCLYATNGAVVIGFTLADGGVGPNQAPNSPTEVEGGGAWCQSTNVFLSNCVITANSAVTGGGVYSGTLKDCVISSNSIAGGSTFAGGGAYLSTMDDCLLINNTAVLEGGGAIAYGHLDHCTLAGNTAGGGGACAYSTLDNCILTNNSAHSHGGGAFDSILTNCVVVNNEAAIGGGADGDVLGRSVLSDCTISGNIATNSSADGGGGASSSILNNCTLSGNTAWSFLGGGGASQSTLNGCLVISNSAPELIEGGFIYSVGKGGGTEFCYETNCILAYNSAGTNGGGDFGSTLVNCTIVSNSAPVAGGGFNSTAENCIIYYNTGGDYSASSIVVNGIQQSLYSLNYCCTSSPTNGLGNITNEPDFANLAGGDFHLSSNSPCINSGNNAYVTTATELDGNPRIVGGTVDIGAYEYQTPVSQISYAWLQQYGLPITNGIDAADLDGTGFTVYQDWIAGLDPKNSLSILAMLPPVPTNNPAGLVVSWESVSNRTYFLQSSTNLAEYPSFSTIQSNIVGQADTTSFTDVGATNSGPYFYRVGVQQ